MNIICHRRNTIQELIDTPKHYGVEIDIRSDGKKLILVHDPFVDGVELGQWLAHYKHRTLILNTKEEGLEQTILDEMYRHDINDFFFLDQSFPFLMKTALGGERRCAVRVSEYESIETALSLRGLIDWVWVDVFSKLSLNGSEARSLRNAGFKLCLVSPELQGRWDDEEIYKIKNHLNYNQYCFDAVCTKTPERWL
jgi:hypothetical protein